MKCIISWGLDRIEKNVLLREALFTKGNRFDVVGGRTREALRINFFPLNGSRLWG